MGIGINFRGRVLVRLLFSFIAGAAVPFAFAPYAIYPLVFVSLAGLFWVWSGISARSAAVAGFTFGMGMFGCGVWWVQISVHQFGLPLYAFSVSVAAAFILVLSLFPALCGFIANKIPNQRFWPRVLLLYPVAWTAGELLRGWVFTGFPWLLLGYSQIDSPLAILAPIVGVYGVSFITALLAGAVLAVACGHCHSRMAGGLILITVLTAAFALDDLRWTQPTGVSKEVALVQGAIPQALKWNQAYRQPSIDLYKELTAPHWGKSLIVWPETAIPAFAEEVPNTLGELSSNVRASGTTLLVGMPTGNRQNDSRYFNSVVQIGASNARYDKRHLVPFGEYLPFDRWVRPITSFLRIPMSNFSAGDPKQALFQADGYTIGTSICYEDAYAHEISRALPEANLLVNVSNDAWFGDSIAPHQHLQIARMRALENERYLLRATNTGISAIISDRGKIIAQSGQFKPQVVSGDARPRIGATPVSRFGISGAVILCLLAALAAMVVARSEISSQ